MNWKTAVYFTIVAFLLHHNVRYLDYPMISLDVSVLFFLGVSAICDAIRKSGNTGYKP